MNRRGRSVQRVEIGVLQLARKAKSIWIYRRQRGPPKTVRLTPQNLRLGTSMDDGLLRNESLPQNRGQVAAAIDDTGRHLHWPGRLVYRHNRKWGRWVFLSQQQQTPEKELYQNVSRFAHPEGKSKGLKLGERLALGMTNKLPTSACSVQIAMLKWIAWIIDLILQRLHQLQRIENRLFLSSLKQTRVTSGFMCR